LVVVVSVAVLLLTMALQISIVLVNRPKFLVPPNLRGEPGSRVQHKAEVEPQHQPREAAALAAAPDGSVIRSGQASFIRSHMMVDGGHLELSADRLTFRPHRLNVGASALAWALNDIRQVEPGPRVNAIRIQLNNGSEVKLRVWKPATWVADIRAVQSNAV
jgi:hypothetical protein